MLKNILLFVIIPGVLCNALVVELSSSTPLYWGYIFKTKSFYLLIAYLFLYFIINRAKYRDKENLKKNEKNKNIKISFSKIVVKKNKTKEIKFDFTFKEWMK